MGNWFITGIKAVKGFYDRHPAAKIITGGILCGVTGVAATWGSQLTNKGVTQIYGDYSPQAAAASAKAAYDASQKAIKAANAAKLTAVDTVNLASRFLEK